MQSKSMSSLFPVLACLIVIMLAIIPFINESVPFAIVLQSVPSTVYLACFALALLLLLYVNPVLFSLCLAIGVVSLCFDELLNQSTTNSKVESDQFLGDSENRYSSGLMLDKPFNVVSWNTEYWDQIEGPRSLGDRLRTLASDILLLQEHVYLNTQNNTLMEINQSTLLEKCCGYKNVWAKGELVVASKFRGEIVEVADPFVLAVELTINSRKVVVVNVHVPVHVDVSKSFLTKAFWDHQAAAIKRRSSTFRSISALLKSNKSIVIGGDFNSTLLMPTFRRSVLYETGSSFRDIFQLTFPANSTVPPLWKLDHLVGISIAQHRCRVITQLDKDQSDHYPVSCSFSSYANHPANVMAGVSYGS